MFSVLKFHLYNIYIDPNNVFLQYFNIIIFTKTVYIFMLNSTSSQCRLKKKPISNDDSRVNFAGVIWVGIYVIVLGVKRICER